MRIPLVVSILLLLGNIADSQAGTLLPVGSGFNNPLGIALDGSGNLFVADQGNNAVKEVVAAGGYATVNTLGSGFTGPTAVAVDASSNVFVIDAGNSTIKEIVAAGGYSTVNTLGSAFSHPIVGIAVDGAGNVLFTDTVGTLREYVAATNFTTLNPLASSVLFSGGGVGGFALDHNGNAFLVGGKAVEEFFASTAYSTSTSAGPVGLNLQNSAFIAPATDAAGNLFVGQYQFSATGDYILQLLPSNSFNYNLVYTATPPNVASGIAVGGNGIFLSGVPANAVSELIPPTPVTLQEFGVD